MQFLIRHDLTGETFTVTGLTREECRAQADTECARRGWDVMTVGSERVEKESLKQQQSYQTKELVR